MQSIQMHVTSRPKGTDGSRTSLQIYQDAMHISRLIEANFIAQFTDIFPRLLPIVVHDEPYAMWCESPDPSAFCNRVFRVSCSANDTARVVGDMLQHFVACGRHVSWYLGPSSRPSLMGHSLAAFGLAPCHELVGMATAVDTLELDSPPPPFLTVLPVFDKNTLAEWVQLTSRCFGYTDSIGRILYGCYAATGLTPSNPLQLFAGVTAQGLVGVSRLFVSNEVGGVYHVACHPSFRRYGIGTAMTVSALREARAQGCRLAVLHASPLGRGLYRKLGLVPFCTIDVYRHTKRAAIDEDEKRRFGEFESRNSFKPQMLRS